MEIMNLRLLVSLLAFFNSSELNQINARMQIREVKKSDVSSPTSRLKEIESRRHHTAWNLSTAIKPLQIARGGGDSSSETLQDEFQSQKEAVKEDLKDEIDDNERISLENSQEYKDEEVEVDQTKSTSSIEREVITDIVDDFLHHRIYSTDFDEIVESKIPISPQKLLHKVAKKIQPIQRSPDILLKIRSASSQDAGTAAYTIGLLAGATDMYEKHQRNDKEGSPSSDLVEDVVKDRRWEQIVECVLCGVDVRKRMKELQALHHDANENSEKGNINEPDREENHVIEGLDVPDASRAAWGLSTLGVDNYVDKLGGETLHDILTALSLRCQDILNNQWNELNEFALSSSNIIVDSPKLERWDDSKENLARDAARSMWAFACVKACTNVRSDYLLATCCNILTASFISQDNLRKKTLEAEAVLDRLADIAKNDGEENDVLVEVTKEGNENNVDSLVETKLKNETGTDTVTESVQSNPMLSQHLSPLELANVIWALAVHNNDIHATDKTKQIEIVNSKIGNKKIESSSDEKEYDSTLVQHISRQILKILEDDLKQIETQESTYPSNNIEEINKQQILSQNKNDEKEISFSESEIKDSNHANNTDSVNNNEQSERDEPEGLEDLEVIDAAALLTDAQSPAKEILRNSTIINDEIVGETELIEDRPEPGLFTDTNTPNTVEVVDAAALLRGEEDQDPEIIHLDEDSEQYSDTQYDTERDTNLEVLDSASLLMGDDQGKCELQSEGAENSENSEDEEIIINNTAKGKQIDSEPTENGENILGSTNDENKGDISVFEEYDNNDPVLPIFEQSFASKDLCSIAWAVTQLQWRPYSQINGRDSANEYGKIIHLIVSILTKVGNLNSRTSGEDPFTMLKESGFTDLSNLAWAIAKYVKGMRSSRSLTVEEEANISYVTCEIAHWSLLRLSQSVSTFDNNFKNSNDDQFIPPTLSRLIWSLTTISQEFKNGKGAKSNSEKLHHLLGKLTIAIIHEAKENLSSYRAEDLARIVWAYSSFEASSTSTQLNTPIKNHIHVALGRIQNTIESALLRWELGRSSEIFDESSIWNIPIFERMSSSARLKSLESSRTSAAEEDKLEEDDKHTLPNRPGRRLLASLNSLPVDPSTLCKVSFAYSKLADLSLATPFTLQQNVGKGAEDLARVAARIFAYSGESLLNQCHPHDIARLCYAYTRSITTASISINNEDRSMCNSETREALTRHFTKKVTQAINDSILFNDSNKDSSSMLDLMAPKHFANLVWSLGELGVQCGENLRGNIKPLKRVRLSAKRPVLALDQLDEMNTASTLNLLHGIIALDDIENDVELLDNILFDIELNKLPTLSASECCRAVFTVTKLRNFVLDICAVKTVEKDNVSTNSTVSNGNVDGAEIETPIYMEEDSDDDLEEIVEVNEEKTASSLLNHCYDLLSSLSERITDEIPHLTASQMRKILQAYHIMPYQADEMVNALEVEIKQRISIIDSESISYFDGKKSNIISKIREAGDQFVDASTILTRMIEGKKKGHDAILLDDDSVSNMMDHMNRAIATACEAATRLERIERGAHIDVESSLRLVENGVAFELGRCLELIDGYRLIEFSSGTRRGRFTGGKKKNLGKRILSRLFQ